MGLLNNEAKKVILFDYDGVIADSKLVFAECYIKACQTVGIKSIDTEEKVLALFEDNVYQTLSSQYGATEQMMQDILKVYGEAEQTLRAEICLFSGMPEVLRALSDQYTVYIITSNVSGSIEKMLENSGLTDCIKAVIGGEKEKSKVKKIKKISREYTAVPIYYIGDTRGDMLEGHAAGAITIGVGWGWHSEDVLRKAGADYIVSTPQELKKTLFN